MSFFKQSELPYTNGFIPLPVRENLATNVMKEITDTEKIPPALAIQAVLGSASLAFSGGYDVEYPLGGIEQLNFYTVTTGGSGIGKSRAFSHPLKPFKDFEKEQTALYKEALVEYESALTIHNDRRNEIRRSKEDSETKTIMLYIHDSNKPKPPKKWKINIEDATPLGALEVAANQPVFGILTPEGKNFLNPKNMQEMEKYCALWSGESISVTRKGYSLDVCGTVPTISIMIQPLAFEKFLEKKGDDFINSGFAARTCFAYVGNTMGERYA